MNTCLFDTECSVGLGDALFGGDHDGRQLNWREPKKKRGCPAGPVPGIASFYGNAPFLQHCSSKFWRNSSNPCTEAVLSLLEPLVLLWYRITLFHGTNSQMTTSIIPVSQPAGIVHGQPASLSDALGQTAGSSGSVSFLTSIVGDKCVQNADQTCTR